MRPMKWLAWVGLAVGVLFLPVPVHADVTVTSTVSGKGMGMSSNATTRTLIKGLKQRSEHITGDNAQVTLIDLDNMTLTVMNLKKREAEVYNLADITETVSRQVSAEPTVKVAPTGKTKEVLSHRCTQYLVTVVLPTDMGGGQKMEVVLNSDLWVAESAPGVKDFVNFHKAMADKQVFWGDPRATKEGTGAGNIRAQNEVYRAWVKLNGIPLINQMDVKFNAEGPLGAIFSKMGFSMLSTVTEITTDALSDELFTVPAGWKIKRK